ncbi:kinase phosphorylation protein-domain-containing protein [Dissophora ornata]|nr:kinase phosphorylation protein-domain-containing protein [Dissophora ornata]
MFHPTRGGTRGGQDQFSWQDVKDDKHRENYLGNSLHAAVGRWQKGRDITWYAKAGDKDSDLAALQASKAAEIQSIKDAEAEAMAEALGYKTKRKTETNVTERELKSAISKNSGAVQDELDEKFKESSAIEGLGFKSRTQRMNTEARNDPNTQIYSARPSTVPLVPLIPDMPASDSAKNKDRDGPSSRDQRGHGRDELEMRHRHRRSSRSASPSRKRRSHRDRSRSRERGDRDERRRGGSSRDQGSRGKDQTDSRHEAIRGKDQQDSRHDSRREQGLRGKDQKDSYSSSHRREKATHGKEQQDSWHDGSHRREQETRQRGDRRRHSRSRSRSHSRSRGK